MDRHHRAVLLRLACLLGALCFLSALASPARAGGGDVLLGKEIYNAKCVECHGRDGKGDGPAAAILSPRPRDFTAGKFKFRSTETGSIPLDADLLRTI
ncbi:MAG TPA: c-type cytochrome, partial [Bacteroidota bacterium]|nr:c-type cytochrome [Bacteroidota bacterium]